MAKKGTTQTYASVLEAYDRRFTNESNIVYKNPNGVADALRRAPKGYSGLPKLQVNKIKGK